MPNTTLLDFEVELLSAEDVAPLFKTTPKKITNAVLNGTLPIGFVSSAETPDERTRTVIIKARFEAWLSARDLNGAIHP